MNLFRFNMLNYARTVVIAKLKEDMCIDSVEGEQEEQITEFGRFSQEKWDNEQPVELLPL